MASSNIHYQFINTKGSESVTFDGPYISLLGLKKMILEKMGNPMDSDLKISNAETKQGTFIYLLSCLIFMNVIFCELKAKNT